MGHFTVTAANTKILLLQFHILRYTYPCTVKETISAPEYRALPPNTMPFCLPPRGTV